MSLSAIWNSQVKLSLLILLGMCVVILTALGFQHIGGYIPCKLCFEQREPWYVGIPVMAIALSALLANWQQCINRGLIGIAGLLMLYSLVLAIRHAGIEWQWWAGPADCAVVVDGLSNTTAENLLEQIDSVKAPACDQAAGRFLGLSFAGWNALASLALAIMAIRAATLDKLAE